MSWQDVPPLSITIQQPVGGMPKWEKGGGALVGILSSIAMAYVKPAIAEISERCSMRSRYNTAGGGGR